MVESLFVDRPELKAASPPIGVFASLARGFERIAGQPALILPPLVLDALLWLGPRLGIQSLFQQAAASLVAPPTVDASVQEGARLLRDALLEAGSRFNLLSLLSTFPVGVPSLMASSMPEASPLGTPMTSQLSDIGVILSLWLALSVVGFGIGAAFHRLIARPIPTSEHPRSAWGLWLRIVALAGLFDAGLLVVGTGALAAASVVSLILPLLGVGVLFIGFSLAFWGAIYLVFTPHGMVRHHLGLREAMRESVDLVRWNLVGTTGLLAVLLAVDRLAGLVWLMPDPASWFAGLAVLGHAFVTAMLVAASYAFYSGRRDWWEARRLAAVAPPATGG
jgi:hypothetical protein